MKSKVLVIEDEKRMRRVIQLVLESQGYQVETACDGREGISKWKHFLPDLVFTDLKMPHADGMQVLRFGSDFAPATPVIILTAFGTIPEAVKAVKIGAHDYIAKPVDNDLILEKAVEALRKKSKIQKKESSPVSILFGRSSSMARVKQEIDLVSDTITSVLITGESGTGKEVVARTIHQYSSRKENPFVKLNCSAIPGELMESELFGHKKGAFTGAAGNRTGAFLMADNSILFLDEVGDLPLPLQPKLLHAVEDKTVTPVGDTRSVRVDVKIISATNQDLAQMVAEKTFRADLFYRLNTYTIHMPPLRERPEDITELSEYFLSFFCREFDREPVMLDEKSIRILQQHSWPGNVRELKNVLERLVLISRNQQVTSHVVGSMIQKLAGPGRPPGSPGPSVSNVKELPDVEREMIVKALNACAWNRSEAARQLGITRNTLRYRIKKYRILSNPGPLAG